MIEITRGDILQADAEALVNTVNCVGVMGRGIALQFKKEFPENFKAYKKVCEQGDMRPGNMLVVPLNQLQNPRYVVNFPTKRHWRAKSRFDDVESGLAALLEEVRERNISSIAIPPLGCGLGGLQWNRVRPLIEEAFKTLPDVRVLLYEPVGPPSAVNMAKSKKSPNMTVGRATLLGLMRHYLAAVMVPYVSLLEVHKLMYFMQEADEPLRLKFAKGPYGPYAENLRHVLSHIEGHFITGYGDAEDDPEKQIEISSHAARRAETFLSKHPRTQKRFERVVDLISGFETPYGMELLATVHWVANRETASKPDDAVAKVYSWNTRKQMFTEDHIRIAWNVLVEKGWVAEE